MSPRHQNSPPEPWTHIGTGVHLDHPQAILELGFPDSARKGHCWCFGTTRVGKTRVMEHILEQDIRKGYSVVAIDPKGETSTCSPRSPNWPRRPTGSPT